MPRLWTPPDQAARTELLCWAEQRLQNVIFDRSRALPAAVMHGEQIAAVIVYHQHRGGTLEMTNAADTPRWATKSVIAELLAWPFVVMGCRRITAIVRADNARARRFDEGIGFEREGVLRDQFEGCDGILYGLTKRDWLASRWSRIWQERHAHEEAA